MPPVRRGRVAGDGRGAGGGGGGGAAGGPPGKAAQGKGGMVRTIHLTITYRPSSQRSPSILRYLIGTTNSYLESVPMTHPPVE